MEKVFNGIMGDTEYQLLKFKLHRVEAQAYTAVRGWMNGYGSPYTMDRCRDLGRAINQVICDLERDDKRLVERSINQLTKLEKEIREKGHVLPYEVPA